MVSAGLQMLGTALAIIGWLGSIIICALPMWKVTAFIGANIVTAQVIWEGLWMNCVTQSTGQMQCKVYDSLLALPQDLQAARALIIIAIIAGVFAILLGIAGGKCTNFVDNERSKSKVAIASGVVFLIAALLVLVPVCWSANTIIRDFYNPLLVEAQRRELGASLYIGWGSAGLMILGGALLCCSCPPKDENLNVKYSKAASSVAGSSRAYVYKQLERQCVLSSAPSNMVSLGIQMLGSALSLLGWVGVILTCILPMWRVTAFIGATIITSQTIWEGIWMSCVVESTGQMQCKPYDSLLALSSDLQAARALTVLAIATGTAGLLLAFVGGKCTRFLDEQGGGVKERVAVTAGAVLIATGVLCLIPTSWAAGAVVQGFYSSATDAQRREIGACLYIGWGASILLILGGGLFISSSCPLRAHDEDKSPSVRYLVVRSSNGAASSQAAASQHSRGPSTKSQANGKMAFTRSHSSQAASAKSQPWGVVKTRPPWEEYGLGMVEQDYMPGSGGSKAPSTKSQLKRLESQESLAEKSQPSEDESLNPTKTYI
uniref:uncharacterized protein LOC124006896 n=1 Tax=Oncorhynchus gorbuscha TaxID=8017 RepID=UPI001EAF6DED|nr:uncharacterized protein LOC124006896 [Oncorhynchus gorbuscha]